MRWIVRLLAITSLACASPSPSDAPSVDTSHATAQAASVDVDAPNGKTAVLVRRADVKGGPVVSASLDLDLRGKNAGTTTVTVDKSSAPALGVSPGKPAPALAFAITHAGRAGVLFVAAVGKTDDGDEVDTFELERFQFTFRKISVEHVQGKTMSADDWVADSGPDAGTDAGN
jgi:hypothetical protein